MFSLINFTEGYTLLVVASGATLLGIVSGAIGSLSLLKKQSLLADSITHASLAGITLAFVVTGTKSLIVFMIGAAIVGWFVALQIFFFSKRGVKQDSLLSLMLAVYFGIGMVLLSYIQHRPGAAQAGIETFLFGQAATTLISDVKAIAVIGAIVLILFALFGKELFLVAFDPIYAHSIGLPITKLNALFALLLVSSIVIGLQSVGVVLMSAMLIAPAAAARQWTNNIRVMVVLAALFGGFSGLAGSIVSSFVPNVPTGPAIIIIVSVITFISILAAPNRGLVWRKLRSHRHQANVGTGEILEALYLLSLQHVNEIYGHDISVVEALFPLKKNTAELLNELRVKGYAVQVADTAWSITDVGATAIQSKISNKCEDADECDLALMRGRG